jgi:hypothetical protein
METVQDIPKVIPNSDYLYKSNIEWCKDIPYQPPNEYEIDMLKGTKSAKELLEEEAVEISEEQKRKDRLRHYLTMFKVITLTRMNLSPIYDTSLFQPHQKIEYMRHMESLVEDYNNDFEPDITNEFNKICIDKIFNNPDVSSCPVFNV